MTKNDAIAALVGKNLELLCFAQYQVNMHLEGDVSITIEGDFEHLNGETGEQREATFPMAESTLMRLIESSVVSAEVDASGCLRIAFSNQDVLNIPPTPGYDSYCIEVGGEEFRA